MIQTVYLPTIIQQANIHFCISSLKTVLMKKGQYLQSRHRHNAKRYFKKAWVVRDIKDENDLCSKQETKH